MQLYFFTRGIKNRVDEFTNDLQAQFFPRKFKGKLMDSQAHLRPIQFWEYVFPAPQLQPVLKMIEPSPNHHNSLNKYGNVLRKLLHAKKIPPIDPSIIKRPIRKYHVQVWGIGIKEDEFNEEGEEQL